LININFFLFSQLRFSYRLNYMATSTKEVLMPLFTSTSKDGYVPWKLNLVVLYILSLVVCQFIDFKITYNGEHLKEEETSPCCRCFEIMHCKIIPGQQPP